MGFQDIDDGRGGQYVTTQYREVLHSFSGKPSSSMKPAVRYKGVAPMTATSLTVPWCSWSQTCFPNTLLMTTWARVTMFWIVFLSPKTFLFCYLKNKFLVNELLGSINVKICRFDKPYEKFINYLKMRPGRFLNLRICWFILMMVVNRRRKIKMWKSHTRTGSSSSGSKASPYGFTWGASVRNRFTENFFFFFFGEIVTWSFGGEKKWGGKKEKLKRDTK